MSSTMPASSPSEEFQLHPFRYWLRMLPTFLSLALLVHLGELQWGRFHHALRLEGKSATVAWLSLALFGLIALYLIFVYWFIMRRYTDRHLALGSQAIRSGRNGLESEYPLNSLKGLRFRKGWFKRWTLVLEFPQGKVKIVPEFENLRELFTTLFQYLGKPLFDRDPRREKFLWRVLRTELIWEMFNRNWWKAVLISGCATWFGKLLAEASPATDERLDLWLLFNLLLPFFAEILAQRILLRKWERQFMQAPSMEVGLPEGYSASVHRKVILGAVLVYLLVYFVSLSDLMLNS